MKISDIARGSGRIVYKVSIDNRSFAIKISSRLKCSIREHRLLRMKLGIPAPESYFCIPVNSETNLIFEEWIDGQLGNPSMPHILEWVSLLKSIHSIRAKSIIAVDLKREIQLKYLQLEASKYETVQTFGKRFHKLFFNGLDTIKDGAYLIGTLLHGDFHPGNLIQTTNNQWIAIDWERWKTGSPYFDLSDLVRGVRGGPDMAKDILYSYQNSSENLDFFNSFCILKSLHVLSWKLSSSNYDIKTDLAILNSWIT